MTAGILIAVVGPSGVGKDSVIDGIVAARSGIRRVRRTITRAPGQDGEAYDATTPDAFAQAVAQGAFCLHWGAHDLRYGIPVQLLSDIRSGAICIANLSRGALTAANTLVPRLVVLNLMATPAVRAGRLAARGRETEADIARRLARDVAPLPAGLDVISVNNDGALATSVTFALEQLEARIAHADTDEE